MVLQKWAVVTRGAPPPLGWRLQAKRHRVHPALAALSGEKAQDVFVLRPFVKDPHVEQLNFIENRGMYKEEWSIERGRFPRFQRTLFIGSDGSVAEREFEFSIPPLVLLYNDRRVAHRARMAALHKIGKQNRLRMVANLEEVSAPQQPVANALCFPYAVPSLVRLRPRVDDPLRQKAGQISASE